MRDAAAGDGVRERLRHMFLADDVGKALGTVLAGNDLVGHGIGFGVRPAARNRARGRMGLEGEMPPPGNQKEGRKARVTTADGSKLPLLPSGPGGVRKSAFHGPWRR